MIEVLSRLAGERGAPRYLRSDNGPEFVSRALLRWATSESLSIALIDPGAIPLKGWDSTFDQLPEQIIEINKEDL